MVLERLSSLQLENENATKIAAKIAKNTGLRFIIIKNLIVEKYFVCVSEICAFFLFVGFDLFKPKRFNCILGKNQIVR